MKNYKLITVIFICFVISCNKTSSKVDTKMSTFENKIENENFDVFIKRFSNDSVFQKSRIIFPLKAETYDVETFTYNNEYETLENWRFERLFNHSNPKIINNIKTVKNQKIFLYQTEDTGIHIEYFFKLTKNRWVLYLIKDSSTQLKYSGSSAFDSPCPQSKASKNRKTFEQIPYEYRLTHFEGIGTQCIFNYVSNKKINSKYLKVSYKVILEDGSFLTDDFNLKFHKSYRFAVH